ncbi:MAG: sigma 54-interacting transcriptional regulator [Clostridia bacterium]|nr:sigma 54-interacting transcriptional regulator [Clostridia bacterium]
MKNRDYITCMQSVLQLIDEGVHVVDREGNSIVYNRSMAQLEKMESRDVLRKPFAKVFKNLTTENSTLLQALETGRSTWKKEQTYMNKDGKQITTMNTTIPVMDDGEVIAAVEIAKNITDIQQMTSTIIELRKEIDTPKKEREKRIRKYKFDDLYGENRDFLKTIALAKRVAETSASCMIYGETGTGKELIAQSIHYASDRAGKPFLAQNCAAVPANLLEGLLFGTSKGGFTGAVDRPGLFEQADEGTLLLDEINSMPMELQGKLLRVLQENYIRRVGGTKDIPVDVRVIATINEPAEDLIAENRLRKDLLYRIAVLQLEIPPLRERRDDIILLAEKFMDKYDEKYGRQAWMISDAAKEKLLSYDYPGNVRELENIIMSAVSMLSPDAHVIEEDDLIINRRKSLPTHDVYTLGEGGLEEYLAKIEREMIENALVSSGGNITKAAENLKIKRQTLQHKIKKYKESK